MFNSSKEEDDDSHDHKRQRARKRARDKHSEEPSLEPGERHQRAVSIGKRRSALTIEDTEKQICSYFDLG
jgi:hypothetical protein